MFRASLEAAFLKIFAVKKVTFDQPSDMKEQECIFIEIENSRNVFKDGRSLSMVTGSAFMFGNEDKLPFGFFSKAIAQADSNDTGPFFFSDIESNAKFYRNLVQRGFSFVYFFDSQYDPRIGTITSVNIEEI